MIDQNTLQNYLEKIGEKKYRTKQIMHAFYRELCSDFSEMTVLSEELRDKLTKKFPFSSLKLSKEAKSKDKQTTKVLFELKDGSQIESVLLEHHHRTTICVSTQVGCPNRCGFCSTGRMGFKRNLTSEEIVDQVLYFARELKKQDKKVNNVVLMGMGEPMLNYKQMMMALNILNDPNLFGLGARHFTISTSGIIPGIKKLSEDNDQFYLAISLHAPTQELREKIMPIAKKYPLNELMETINEYTETTGNRIFYEYTLIKGINDSEKNAHELVSLLRRRPAHVNLIRCHEGMKGFHAPNEQTVKKFQRILTSSGISNTLRISMGEDISAACGQLANK